MNEGFGKDFFRKVNSVKSATGWCTQFTTERQWGGPTNSALFVTAPRKCEGKGPNIPKLSKSALP